MKADPDLWSGCVSGAFQEQELLAKLSQLDADLGTKTSGDDAFRVDQGAPSSPLKLLVDNRFVIAWINVIHYIGSIPKKG